MKKKKILLLIAVFLVTLMVGLLVSHAITKNAINEKKELYVYVARERAGYIRSSIERVLYRFLTMEEMIVDHNGDLEFFTAEAARLVDKIYTESGLRVRCLAVAPDSVVTKVYPVEGNESLLNFRYLDETLPGNENAVRAYEQGRVLITDPFPMVQGGSGIAVRTPVFLKDAGGTPYFWGICALTINYDDLLKNFELSSLEKAGLDYELWYADQDDQRHTLANSEKMPEDSVNALIKFNTMEWNLNVAPHGSWNPKTTVFLRTLLDVLIAAVLTALLSLLLRVRQTQKKLKDMAVRDTLTGCYSRWYLFRELVDEVTMQWKDWNRRYSLAMVDIDFLKTMNDSYGHEVGDAAICAVAEVLNEHTVEGDCVVRYGGDEFIVMWKETDSQTIRTYLENIVQAIRERKLPQQPDLHLSVSIGAACNHDDVTYNDLFKRADDRLYRAKKNGKDRFVMDDKFDAPTAGED